MGRSSVKAGPVDVARRRGGIALDATSEGGIPRSGVNRVGVSTDIPIDRKELRWA
jgi:hypothetical protein